MTFGFIGLGAMGQGMALNILKAGIDLTVCDLNADAVQVLTKTGAGSCESPKQLADTVDTVFLCVPGAEDVRAVIGDCLRHRVVPSFEAQAEGVTADDLVARVVELVALA